VNYERNKKGARFFETQCSTRTLTKQTTNDKASRCCWSAYQEKRLGEMRIGKMRLGKMRRHPLVGSTSYV